MMTIQRVRFEQNFRLWDFFIVKNEITEALGFHAEEDSRLAPLFPQKDEDMLRQLLCEAI